MGFDPFVDSLMINESTVPIISSWLWLAAYCHYYLTDPLLSLWVKDAGVWPLEGILEHVELTHD